MKTSFLYYAIACVVLGTALNVHAESRARAKSMIVIFNPDTPFQRYRAEAREDERQLNDPAAWAYLNRGVVAAVQRLEKPLNFRATHVYSHAVHGFAAELTPEQVEALKKEAIVSYVEDDQLMRAMASTLPWGVERVEADLSSTAAADGHASVEGVHAYVIDTGISRRPDLNLVEHVSFISGRNTDCNGHGTHVASTLGAREDRSQGGVAPGVPLHGVKVLDCDGFGLNSVVIKGVDWVTANAVRPAVANMSLGGGMSRALDTAVLRSIAGGVFYALAAGNEGRDACQSSPARVGRNANGVENGAVATGAVDGRRSPTSFSNFGDCVDMWSSDMRLPRRPEDGPLAHIRGTSMATPHTAGGAALYLASNPAATPAQVEAALRKRAARASPGSEAGRSDDLLQLERF